MIGNGSGRGSEMDPRVDSGLPIDDDEPMGPLLELARSLGIRVRGLSFHVGSQVREPKKYVEAIGVCAELIAQARAADLAQPDLLDIGGGFPIAYGGRTTPIRTFCTPIRRALRRLPPGIQVIAEPGRFIAGPAGTAVASATRRTRTGRSKRSRGSCTSRRSATPSASTSSATCQMTAASTGSC